MKTFTMQSSIEIASNVIEKLQEENRISLETLHKTQNEIQILEKQLSQKDQLIKILEEQLRRGSNYYLETNIRQKDMRIKHLELQVEKLVKDNQELSLLVNSGDTNVCAKCENKLGSSVSLHRKSASKSCVKKGVDSSVKASKSDNKDNRYVRIIEHKDKRIQHLSTEVRNLQETEKELNDKYYRLQKRFTLSHANNDSETIIDCLLREITSLETQNRLLLGGSSESKPNLWVRGVGIPSRTNICSDNPKRASFKKSIRNELDSSVNDGVLLLSKLHKLHNDIIELKQFFVSENERMHQNLTRDSMLHDSLKIQLKDIIRKLDEIARCITSVIQSTSSSDASPSEEKLQDMLKSCLELNSQYEEENVSLKTDLRRLSEQLAQEQRSLECAEMRARQSAEELSRLEQNFGQDATEVQRLKTSLKDKERQLSFTENHLKTCQSLIEELQKPPKDLSPKEPGAPKTVPDDRQLKILEKKLEVAEKNIKNLEGVIEDLHQVMKNLEEDNSRLESDLHLANLKKAVSDANANHYVALKTKLDEAEDKLVGVTASNQELTNKMSFLEEENERLQSNLNVCNDNVSQEKNSLQAQLNSAERKIGVFENNMVRLQTSVEKLKEENARLRQRALSETDKDLTDAYVEDVSYLKNEVIMKDEQIRRLKESLEMFERKAQLSSAEPKNWVLENNMVCLQTSVEKLKVENAQLRRKALSSETDKDLPDTYVEDVSFLKNEVIMKDEQIRRLKESLEMFERKVFEINHYRKALRQEIEKLCDAMTAEDHTASQNRQAIYNAAVLRSSQAILRLDEEDGSRPRDVGGDSDALEQMKNQVSVYLTEVARIHELLTLKSQQREELIRQYLSEGSGASSLFFDRNSPQSETNRVRISPAVAGRQRMVVGGSLSLAADASSVRLDSSSERKNDSPRMSDKDRPIDSSFESRNRSPGVSRETSRSPIVQVPPSTVTLESDGHDKHSTSDKYRFLESDTHEKRGTSDKYARRVEEDLEASKGATSYFLAKCSELEDRLDRERAELERAQKENASRTAEMEALLSRLRSEEEAKRQLGALLAQLQSRDAADEISMEQLKAEVQWLLEENQRTFEKVTLTQSELRRCQEENGRVQNDLDVLRRQLLNEKYEHAKVNNQLKHLQLQISQTPAAIT